MAKKKTLTDLEWMDKHIQLRKTIVDDLLKVSKVAYNVKAWTPLKLISIGYFTKIYTTIISKYFERWIYCEFFAGCGLNLIKNVDYFLGSPFMVLEAAKVDPFHRVYLVEKKLEYAKALNNRLEWCSRNLDDYSFLGRTESSRCLYTVYNESYEDFLLKTDFIKELESNDTHALIVIDPEGFEIGWEHLYSLFNYPVDIIYTFMTSQIRREWGKARKGDKNAIYNMQFLFGNNSWEEAESDKDLTKIFEKNLNSHNRSVIPIKIQDTKTKFYYHLFVITRITKGGNPWLNGVRTLKKRIENAQSGMVQASLDYLQKRSKRVTDFF